MGRPYDLQLSFIVLTYQHKVKLQREITLDN